MDASVLARRMTEELGDGVAAHARSAKRLWVKLPADRLLDAVAWLRGSLPGLRLATSTGIDLREGVGVFHHLAVNGEPLVITLKLLARRPEPSLPSLAASIPAATWIEREISELLGVEFRGHPDPRRLLKARNLADGVHPLRRDFETPGAGRGREQGGEPCGT